MDVVLNTLDIKKIRLENLQKIADFEKKLGKGVNKRIGEKADTDPNYISQILSTKSPASVGDVLARRLESAYGFEWGWMDERNDDTISPSNYPTQNKVPEKIEVPAEINMEALQGALAAVEEYCKGNCIKTTAEKKAKAVAILYKLLLTEEEPSAALVNALLEML